MMDKRSDNLEAEATPGEGATVRSKGRPAWQVVAALLMIGGMIGTVLAATSVASNDRAKSRQAFTASSGDVASTLGLAINREEDLIVSASGFIAGNPEATNLEFHQWASSVSALARYPELIGFGNAVVVPLAGLPAFAAHSEADPAGTLPANGTFSVIPAGERTSYCLVATSLYRNGQDLLPAGYDLCAPGSAGSVSSSEVSGQSAYQPLVVGKNTFLTVQTPIYRGGVVPATTAGRLAAFLGWVGVAVVPEVVLDRALQGHPNTAVTLTYDVGSSHAQFQSGQAPSHAQSVTINLDNGWTVTTNGASAPSGIWGNSNALDVVVAGVLLSALLALLVLVLGTGRARALRTVRQKTGELRHQALHDALTGLPNRALILDRIEQLLARNRRQGTVGAALYVDLDEFKNVNDSLGHQAGDRLLMAVTARLRSTLRDADTIGRMGGDEFIVLLDGATMQVGPELVAERLLEVLRRPFELPEATMPLIVNASIGIAIGDRANPGDLLRDADVALYQAKAGGKNRYAIYHPEMQTEIQDRIELEFELRAALEGSQFHLVYQPIYNLDDLALVGVEALLRWDHPTRGLVQPDDFIPILEQTGQIREVGRWVLHQACEQMAIWHARGDTLDISVNVSGRQLDDDAIVDDIMEALTASGLSATSLIIEVTETALMRNVEATSRRLREIKQLGVRIAVDDFGTGYSSLAYLQQFPVDCLKIDRSFTEAISTSPESKALIGTLVQLGRDLGLKTLAEGVETTDQMDHLRGEHVDEAQGFLLARPLDSTTFEAQLLVPTRAPAITEH